MKLKDDYKVLLLMSALTLLLIYFMRGAGNGGGAIPIAVIDHSNNIYSKQLIEEIGKSSLMKIETTSFEKGIREVREDKYQAALIIPKEFGYDIQVIFKPTMILLGMGILWFAMGLKFLRFEN